jgi:hypothetical protein
VFSNSQLHNVLFFGLSLSPPGNRRTSITSIHTYPDSRDPHPQFSIHASLTTCTCRTGITSHRYELTATGNYLLKRGTTTMVRDTHRVLRHNGFHIACPGPGAAACPGYATPTFHSLTHSHTHRETEACPFGLQITRTRGNAPRW